jgi:hypothetical protein
LLSDKLAEAFTHLPTSFDRERAAYDILWLIAMVRKQVRDACSERFGFARAWRRKNLEDRGGGGNRLALSVIQTIKDGIHDMTFILGIKTSEGLDQSGPVVGSPRAASETRCERGVM